MVLREMVDESLTHPRSTSVVYVLVTNSSMSACPKWVMVFMDAVREVETSDQILDSQFSRFVQDQTIDRYLIISHS